MERLRFELVTWMCFCQGICQRRGEPRRLWKVTSSRPLTLREQAYLQGEIVSQLREAPAASSDFRVPRSPFGAKEAS